VPMVPLVRRLRKWGKHSWYLSNLNDLQGFRVFGANLELLLKNLERDRHD